MGFPGGAVVGGPPASAGDVGSGPDPGGSHMPRSRWARVPRQWRPACLGPVFRGGEWPPLAAAGGSPRAVMGTQCSQE